jgi:hypothetical protein
MTPLEAIQLTNSGLLLWSTVGPLVEQAMKNGVDVNMDDVEAASKELGAELDLLKVAIELKKIRDAAK